jgi:trehalose 6-phosphate phosphatase
MDVAEAAGWLAGAPSETALFSDFDGTLSPIVSRPEDASPLPGVPELLKRLAARMLVVAVVSGRPLAWLVEKLDLSGADQEPPGGVVRAYGLHGLEHWSGRGIETERAALPWQPAIAEARASALAAGVPGIEVEDKQFGVTLHWRNAADPEAAAALATQLAGRLAGANGLVPRTGKSSVELVPPIGIDKGTVVRRLVETTQATRVAFLGDDMSDVPAFQAIDGLLAGDTSGPPTPTPVSALKIAVAGNEAPAELTDRADLVLRGPDEAVLLLVELAQRLETGGC